MSITYTEDKSTGIKRQINKGGYLPADHLPGAIMIPSNAGQFGGQQGVNLDDPIEMVVNPGEANEIKLSSSDMRSPLMKQAILECRGDAQKTYQTYAAWKREGVSAHMAKNELGLPKESVHQQAVVNQLTESLQQVLKNSNNVGKSTKGARQPVKSTTRVKQTPDKDPQIDISQDTPETLQVDLQSIISLLGRLAPVQAPDRQPDVKLAPSPVGPAQAVNDPDTVNGMPIPKVRVAFKDSRGGIWESSYHSVNVQGDKIILVYDLSFAFGSKINPPVDFDVPYELTVTPKAADGQPETHWVLNMGINHTFTHGDKRWTFQILNITAKPEPAGQED